MEVEKDEEIRNSYLVFKIAGVFVACSAKRTTVAVSPDITPTKLVRERIPRTTPNCIIEIY